MTRHERYGTRDLAYSAWHRTLDDDLTYIDVDACEYCSRCREPLALIETARDVGQAFKATSVLRALAMRSGVPALLVLYSVDPHGSVTQFRVRSVAPRQGALKVLTPDQFADGLRRLRRRHVCSQRQAAEERGHQLEQVIA